MTCCLDHEGSFSEFTHDAFLAQQAVYPTSWYFCFEPVLLELDIIGLISVCVCLWGNGAVMSWVIEAYQSHGSTPVDKLIKIA